MRVENECKIKIYVINGYFEYEVPEISDAFEHAKHCVEEGVYRHTRKDGSLEFHKVIKVRVESEDQDRFINVYNDRFISHEFTP